MQSELEIKRLKSEGIMKEQGEDLFSVRLRVVGGHVTTDALRAVAALADRFGTGSVHLTTRQGIEIPHVAYGRLDDLRVAIASSGLAFGATGPTVRTIVACPGASCVHGRADSQGLARKLDAVVGSRRGLPHKFKISVTGCGNACAKPRENDIGIMGMPARYAVFVGGRMGKIPRLGDRLPYFPTEDPALLRLVTAVIDWYAANAEERERLAETLDRVGFEALVEDLEPEFGTLRQ